MIVFKPQNFGMDLINFVPQMDGYDFYSCMTNDSANYTQEERLMTTPFTMFALKDNTNVTSTAQFVEVDGVEQEECVKVSCSYSFNDNLTVIDN